MIISYFYNSITFDNVFYIYKYSIISYTIFLMIIDSYNLFSPSVTGKNKNNSSILNTMSSLVSTTDSETIKDTLLELARENIGNDETQIKNLNTMMNKVEEMFNDVNELDFDEQEFGIENNGDVRNNEMKKTIDFNDFFENFENIFKGVTNPVGNVTSINNEDLISDNDSDFISLSDNDLEESDSFSDSSDEYDIDNAFDDI